MNIPCTPRQLQLRSLLAPTIALAGACAAAPLVSALQILPHAPAVTCATTFFLLLTVVWYGIGSEQRFTGFWLWLFPVLGILNAGIACSILGFFREGLLGGLGYFLIGLLFGFFYGTVYGLLYALVVVPLVLLVRRLARTPALDTPLRALRICGAWLSVMCGLVAFGARYTSFRQVLLACAVSCLGVAMLLLGTVLMKRRERWLAQVSQGDDAEWTLLETAGEEELPAWDEHAAGGATRLALARIEPDTEAPYRLRRHQLAATVADLHGAQSRATTPLP